MLCLYKIIFKIMRVWSVTSVMLMILILFDHSYRDVTTIFLSSSRVLGSIFPDFHGFHLFITSTKNKVPPTLQKTPFLSQLLFCKFPSIQQTALSQKRQNKNFPEGFSKQKIQIITYSVLGTFLYHFKRYSRVRISHSQFAICDRTLTFCDCSFAFFLKIANGQ